MPIGLTPFTPPTVAPDTTPLGPLAVALDALRTLVANVGYFQSWTGTANVQAALLRVFVGEMGWPVTQVAVAADVLTITTREPHTLSVGDTVTLQGAGAAAQGLDVAGELVVTGVTDTTVTAALEGAAEFEQRVQDVFLLPTARPFAVVSEGDDSSGGLRATVIGSGGTAVYAGSLEILVEDQVGTQYANDPRNALTEARNKLGRLVQGLAETQGTGDLMVLNDVAVAVGVQLVPVAEGDDVTKRFTRWQALVRVTWGIES